MFLFRPQATKATAIKKAGKKVPMATPTTPTTPAPTTLAAPAPTTAAPPPRPMTLVAPTPPTAPTGGGEPLWRKSWRMRSRGWDLVSMEIDVTAGVVREAWHRY